MSDPRLSEWIALRRVHDGGVAKVAGLYLDHGRPAPSHLIEVFDRLTWDGLLVVADGDPIRSYGGSVSPTPGRPDTWP